MHYLLLLLMVPHGRTKFLLPMTRVSHLDVVYSYLRATLIHYILILSILLTHSLVFGLHKSFYYSY